MGLSALPEAFRAAGFFAAAAGGTLSKKSVTFFFLLGFSSSLSAISMSGLNLH